MISFALILSLVAPVQWLVDLLHPVLLFFHDTIGVGWGMSIVLLTVVVRALLAPLAVKQFKSMQSMVRVAPQLKELQAKHSDDKQRQQQEVMKFYADNKINPFASCLPLVAQIPFFIGLYALLQTDLKVDICGRAAAAASKTPCAQIAGAMTGNEDFLFISDLTVKATGWVLALLIVLYISSQLLSSLLTPSTADRNQRLIMYGLPFVFVILILRFPAGLIVYWITTNLWTVTQGYILRRRIGPVTAPTGKSALSGALAPRTHRRGGGFTTRLAALIGPAKNGAATPDAKPSPSATKPNSAARRDKATAKPAHSGPPPPRSKKKRSGKRR
jgi:YidC/Oxa1 family membrane protein insertase